MKNISLYINEALNLDLAKEYASIQRYKKTENYMYAFWDELKEYVLNHDGKESRNGYRLYLPYTGPDLKIAADDDETAGGRSYGVEMRQYIIGVIEDELSKRGQRMTDNYDYINGTMEVEMEDLHGHKKTRVQKMGKFLVGKTDSKGVKLLDFFNSDPIRLGKNILSAIKAGNLWIAISNHAYDIAGMSTDREWSSCMNLVDGTCKDYVKEDIKYGTLIAYLIDKNDTNIERPYGRVLIKPYKLRRKGHVGFDEAPIVYSPEVTVYSPYVGLKPVREWLKDICEEIQDGEGILNKLNQLYNDTYHDKADIQFKGRKN